MSDWTVILSRGSNKEPLTYHDNKKRAHTRAYALAEVHGCLFTISEDIKTITVFADNFYDHASKRFANV